MDPHAAYEDTDGKETPSTIINDELDYEKAVGTPGPTLFNSPLSPNRRATFALPRSITIQEDEDAVLGENRLRRQTSVGLGPQRADVPSRVIGEFRCVAAHTRH